MRRLIGWTASRGELAALIVRKAMADKLVDKLVDELDVVGL